MQQCIELVVGRCIRLDEGRRAIGFAAVDAVQDQTVQVDVQVGGGPEALDRRDGAAVAVVVSDEPGSGQQVPRDHNALHHLQHRRDQLGLRGQQHAQRDRQRQHPLPHRHVGDDVVHQVRCRL